MLRTVLFFVFGVVPASALGVIAALVASNVLAVGAWPLFLWSVAGLVGAAAMWCACAWPPNKWIYLGLACGIAAVAPFWLLLYSEPEVRFGGDVLLLALALVGLSASLTAVLYMFGLLRPRLSTSGGHSIGRGNAI